jgi:hypothetical protein
VRYVVLVAAGFFFLPAILFTVGAWMDLWRRLKEKDPA